MWKGDWLQHQNPLASVRTRDTAALITVLHIEYNSEGNRLMLLWVAKHYDKNGNKDTKSEDKKWKLKR